MKTAAFRSAAAAALLLAATHAFAQEGGFYLSAAAMATIAGPHDFAIGSRPAQDAEFTANRTGSGSFGVGFLGFRAAFGYDIVGLRPEAEISYRQVDLTGFEYKSFSQDGADLPDAALEALNDSISVQSGTLMLLAAMANLWIDLPTGTPVAPYFGGGAGLGRVTLDSRTSATFPDGSDFRAFPESTGSTFAFQAGAGLGLKLGGVSFSLGYRLAGTTEAELAWIAKDAPADELLKVAVLLHSVELGIALRF